MNEHDNKEVSGWSPDALIAALSQGGDDPAVLSVRGGEVEVCTRTGLADLVLGAARRLADEQVAPGNIVALYALNSPAWIATALACTWIGAVLAPIDALTAPEDVKRLIEEERVSVIVTDSAKLGEMSGLRTIAVDSLEACVGTGPPRAAAISGSSPMAIFRTSGTTGPPKKFHLTHRNIGSNVQAIAGSGILRAHDRVLMPLPLHHVYPWVTATLTSLSVGATLILPEGPTGPQIAEALRRTHPSVIVGVPKLYEAFVTGIRQRFRGIARPFGWLIDLTISAVLLLRRFTGVNIGRAMFWPIRRLVAPGLRMMVSGGARLSPEIADWIDAFGWDLRSGYGLAETASIFTGNLHAKRLNSEGQPIAGGELRIDSPDAEGVGEILLKGPNVFSGYLENPEENAKAFSEDGLFRTGDLGWLDREGFLYVTGRAKEVIVLGGGKNIYPEDVEKKYVESPDIAEIGIFEKDGELHGLVVPDFGVIAARGALRPEDAVRTALAGIAKTLPSTQRLSGFALSRESLPRTLLGKKKRFRLPELYAEAKSHRQDSPVRELTSDEQAWVGETPRAAVWSLLKSEFAGRRFDLDSHLQLDLGLDSFGWMTLALHVEQSTGVRLEPQQISEIGTVRELLATVTNAAQRPGLADAADYDRRLEADRQHWLSPRSVVERFIGRAVLALNRAVMRTLFQLEVEGEQHLPKTGPFLICPNHASDLDPAAIAASLPPGVRERTFWAADVVRVFSSRILRFFCRAVRIFPVDETVPLVAVDLATEVLRRSNVQVWFPEGWRSADGMLLPFQAGIGMIARKAQVPIVPAYIEGTLDALPRGQRVPRLRKTKVVFGPPVTLRELSAGEKSGETNPEVLAAKLRLVVADLARKSGADILSR